MISKRPLWTLRRSLKSIGEDNFFGAQSQEQERRQLDVARHIEHGVRRGGAAQTRLERSGAHASLARRRAIESVAEGRQPRRPPAMARLVRRRAQTRRGPRAATRCASALFSSSLCSFPLLLPSASASASCLLSSSHPCGTRTLKPGASALSHASASASASSARAPNCSALHCTAAASRSRRSRVASALALALDL